MLQQNPGGGNHAAVAGMMDLVHQLENLAEGQQTMEGRLGQVEGRLGQVEVQLNQVQQNQQQMQGLLHQVLNTLDQLVQQNQNQQQNQQPINQQQNQQPNNQQQNQQPVLNQEQILAVAFQQSTTYTNCLLRKRSKDVLLPFGQRPNFWPANFDTDALMGLTTHDALQPFLAFCGLPLTGTIRQKRLSLRAHLTGNGPHL